MKFSLFVHMERVTPDEPEDRLYREMLALSDIADRGGMHAIWTGEHHGMSFTIAPNPFLNLVDLARRTKNVRLGTGTVIAPFWHPIKLAGEAAMADIIMDGRLDLGIARGAYSFEYERVLPGLDAWKAGQMMREMVPALKASGRATTPTRASSGAFPRPPRHRSRSRRRTPRSGWRPAIRTATNSPSPTTATSRSRRSTSATPRSRA